MWNHLLKVAHGLVALTVALAPPAIAQSNHRACPLQSSTKVETSPPAQTRKPISSEEYLVDEYSNQYRYWSWKQTESDKSQMLCEQVGSPRHHKRRPRIALVLGGGGLRGAAHVGVLRELEREKIPIDMVVGTSIGAIIGGLYCSGVPSEKLESDLVPAFVSSYFETPILVQALKINTGLLLMRKPDGLYNGNGLARCITRHIPAEKREISNFKPKFGAVTTDLVTGKTVVLTKGDLAKALQATSAVPGFKGPVKMDNSVLVDGGITCNLPVEQARQLGADFVIAVDVDEKIEQTHAEAFRGNLPKIGARVVSLMLAKMDEAQKAQANIYIQPNVTGIPLLSKKIADGNRAMAEGVVAAKSILPELKLKLTLAGVDLEEQQNLDELPEPEFAMKN